MESVTLRAGTYARTLNAAVAALFLVAHAPAAAQELPGQDVPGQGEMQELFEEFQEKSERFERIHSQAMEENEDLQEKEAELQEQMNDAVLAADPDFEEGVERLGELQAEMMEAQAEEDQAAAQEIMQEAQALEGRLQQAQAQAMQQPDIQQGMEDFQEALITKMTEIDPEAEELLERLEELSAIIQGGHGGGPGGGPPGGGGG